MAKDNEIAEFALVKFIDENSWDVVDLSTIKGSLSVGSIAQVNWQGHCYNAKIKSIGSDRKSLEADGALMLAQSDDENEKEKYKSTGKRKKTDLKSSRKRLMFKPEGIASAPAIISTSLFYGKLHPTDQADPVPAVSDHITTDS